MRKLIESARAPAEIREYMDSRRKLSFLRQTDLGPAMRQPRLEMLGVFSATSICSRIPLRRNRSFSHEAPSFLRVGPSAIFCAHLVKHLVVPW